MASPRRSALRSLLSRWLGSGRPSTRPRVLPRLEVLEDRTTPSTFTVTTALDVVNASDGVTSLREAVALANANAGSDTIVFDASLAGATLVLTAGQLSLTGPTVINGLGMGQLTISGNDASRIFTVAANAPVTITDLTIRDGLGTNTGGAISSASPLALVRSAVRDSVATGSQPLGGGIYVNTTAGGAILTLTDSEITGNTATGSSGVQGGGVYVLATSGTGVSREIAITGTTISGNSAIATNTGAYYGGIYAEVTTGGGNARVSLTNSTVSNNTASATSTATVPTNVIAYYGGGSSI